eukprot:CAMPEP_0203671374 /NCGR_PEP_ID=MMETSP0090-20130426/7180_1 /ASSEMBLY_ACC=CAM_ASM_001088 /TAXON_ID=426623 /ORGANISM="Chaetoceros affinis, Strain CCMP159" /LENGTH=219 /DNA_ID=CAMNT_0050536435 /DNA_START=52 /DNA_END=708 /DNA_ORIENTATION=+
MINRNLFDRSNRLESLSYKYYYMLLPLVVGLLSLNLAEASLSLSVESGDVKCITFKTPKDQKSKINGSFDMLDIFSMADPLLFTITPGDYTNYKDNNDNNNNNKNQRIRQPVPVYTADGTSEGRFHIEGSGKYNLCIENGIKNPPDGEARSVAFTIRVKPAFEHHDEEPNPVTEDISVIEDMAETLIENLYELLDHQEFLKERERLHRDVTESTFGNIW